MLFHYLIISSALSIQRTSWLVPLPSLCPLARSSLPSYSNQCALPIIPICAIAFSGFANSTQPGAQAHYTDCLSECFLVGSTRMDCSGGLSNLALLDSRKNMPSIPKSDVHPNVNEVMTLFQVLKLGNGLTSSKDVHELLECPVCTKPMYPPIHQCSNGHTLCVDCKARVHNRCPACRTELGNIRCLALEKVAAALELPCRYHPYGCFTMLPYYNKLKHESFCNFRPFNCPYAGSECSVIGTISSLVTHLRDDHNVDMHNGCTFNHRYIKSNPEEVENATWMLTVFHCFGRHFCLHFEAFLLGMVPVYMAFLRFMGDEAEAKNFSYSLEVGGYGRKVAWQGVPRSIRDSHIKVRDSNDGLLLHRNMALFFSGGDKKELKLRVTGRIWKER